jgi:hypothetical protein
MTFLVAVSSRFPLSVSNPVSITPAPMDEGQYVPGVCNIGPQEIRRRRRSGYVGTAITVGLFAVLVVIDAPPITRLVLFVPAAIAASGFIQAHLKFCAGFGQLGVFNFGDRGSTEHVADSAARRKDLVKAWQIGATSGLVGLAVAIVAVLLPV